MRLHKNRNVQYVSVWSIIFGLLGLITSLLLWGTCYNNITGSRYNGYIIEFNLEEAFCCTDSGCKACYNAHIIGFSKDKRNCSMTTAYHTSQRDAVNSMNDYDIGDSIEWISNNHFHNCYEYEHDMFIFLIVLSSCSIFSICVSIISAIFYSGCDVHSTRSTVNVTDVDETVIEDEEDEIHVILKNENDNHYPLFKI